METLSKWMYPEQYMFATLTRRARRRQLIAAQALQTGKKSHPLIVGGALLPRLKEPLMQ
jgi:hypothetical protein